MNDFNKCKEEIIKELSNINYDGDMSDLGNHIGMVIAKYFEPDNDLYEFIGGLRHGVSIANGTHP